jgi:hypothetical protein
MIPNTADATAWPLATTTSIQTSTEGTTASQQCLRSTIYQASHQMDACHLWIPCQINLTQSHQSGKLHGLADADWTQRPKVLSQDNQTAKGHMNQTRKNIRSIKVKTTPLGTCNTSHLHGKKVRNVYTQRYMVCKTMFSDQTGQFPIQSLCGNKYLSRSKTKSSQN